MLSRTQKFQVWDFGLSSNQNKISPTTSQKVYSKSQIFLTPGKRFTLVDLCRAAILKHEVVLDMEIPTSEEEFESIPLTPLLPSESPYNVEICRAALFFRLVTLLQGRSGVRFRIIQSIASLLNEGIIPQFTSDERAGAELAYFISGGSFPVFFEGKTISSSEIDFPFFPLSSSEVYSLTTNKFLLNGVASLISFASTTLSLSLDSYSSLSCECVGASTEPFDPVLFETHRQHRGQITSANNLRLLLEGSARTGQNLATSPEDQLTFESLPQSNGPIYEASLASSKTMELELNSAEAGTSSVSFYPIQSFLTLQALAPALRHLSSSSLRRVRAILALSPSLPRTAEYNSLLSVNWESSFSSDPILDAWLSLQRAIESLNFETCLSLSCLDSLDSPPPLESNSEEKEKREKSEGNNKQRPVTDESHLTPEQRKKAEAARKKKEEKAAQKKAEKEARKAAVGAGRLVLGAGTTALRSFLKANPTFTIDPFDESEGSLSYFILRLVESLNQGGKRKLKIAKGARDYTPDQMRIREQVFNVIRKVFKRHGGVEIDTPVFELKEVLTGKYGEDSKLIYDLADQGGELLSLRYDLTVPFARFLAMNSVGNIKRYHIAKVYRRDQPQMARGRYREFYQCDFDVAGAYSPMVADAEVITVAVEILSELPVGEFLLKLNHRKILDSIFEICGVPVEKFRPICSAVDKLDKATWAQVKEEMINEKGLPEEVADRIGEFVLHKGEPRVLLEQLRSSRAFGDHTVANQALGELATLFDYLEASGSLHRVSFDLSLARGLDYYTGVIYEVVLTSSTSQVGSISAGGRYDNLVGMFSPSGTQTPCVGVSIGVERVFTIMEAKASSMKKNQSSPIQVYVASIGSDLIKERMRIAQRLWAADIATEYSHLPNPKLVKQMDEVFERGIPFMLVFGSDELKKGTVKLKNIEAKTEIEVSMEDLVRKLLEEGCRSVPSAIDEVFLSQFRSVN